MVTESWTPAEAARRSLARFELAAIRWRNVVRVRLGVSEEELSALLHLLEHEQLTQRQLFVISPLSRSGVGAMVNRLEDARLIERVPDPHDRRVRVIRLSERGRQRIRQVCDACDTELDRVLADRPAQELHALADLLSVVAELTDSHAGGPDGDGATVPAGTNGDWRRWG